MKEEAVSLLAAALIWGSMGVAAVQTWRLPLLQCGADSCRQLLPIGVPLGVLLVALLVVLCSVAVGPIGVAPWESFWVLSTPIDRGALLRPALTRVLLVGLALGAAIGLALLALLPVDPLDVIAFLAVGGAATMGAVIVQAHQWEAWAARSAVALLGVLGLVILLRWSNLGDLGRGIGLAVPVAAAAGVALVGGLIWARRSLGSITRTDLAAAGAFQLALAGAAVSSDPALAGDVLVARTSREKGVVHPVRGRGAGAAAVVWGNAVRAVRAPRSMLLAVAALVVALVAARFGSEAEVLIGGLVFFCALHEPLVGLRVTMRGKGLARCLPLSDPVQRLAHVIVPALLVALWCAAFAILAIALGIAPPQAVSGGALTGAAALAAGVRFATQGPPGTTYVMSELGPIPVGMLQRVARGPDAILLGALAAGIGVPAVIVAAVLVAGTCYALCFSVRWD